jgi:hypothetical protein
MLMHECSRHPRFFSGHCCLYKMSCNDERSRVRALTQMNESSLTKARSRRPLIQVMFCNHGSVALKTQRPVAGQPSPSPDLLPVEAQLTNSNASFGQGVRIGDGITEAVFPTILQQDRRYFRRRRQSCWLSLDYRVVQISWTDNDFRRAQCSFTQIAGNSIAVAISKTYYTGNRERGRRSIQTRQSAWCRHGGEHPEGFVFSQYQ